MMKSILLASTIAVCLGQAATAAPVSVFFEDDFDADTQALNAPSLLNWSVSNGSVDVIGDRPGPSFDFYPDNGNYIDMDGSSGDAGRITTNQVFDFIAGVAYRLYFTLGKNGGAEETLTFGFDFLTFSITNTGPIAPDMIDQYRDFTLMADASSALFFEGSGGDYQGMVIDNVILKSVDDMAPIPLPATAPLVMLGLAGLAGLRRRKRA